jgi:hypothetical protein
MQALEQEIARLEVIKKERMKDLVYDLRNELIEVLDCVLCACVMTACSYTHLRMPCAQVSYLYVHTLVSCVLLSQTMHV